MISGIEATPSGNPEILKRDPEIAEGTLELPRDLEEKPTKMELDEIIPPDISYIKNTSWTSLHISVQANLENNVAQTEGTSTPDASESTGLTEEEKAKIKEEMGWSDEIINNIQNMEQYEILKNAGLKEVEINGRKCLIREDIDLDYEDEDGVSNRERMKRGLAPLDSTTGKPIELHHLGQKADSPLVELTEEEHRTGDYEDGKKNQSLWHTRSGETEVHGEGNTWDQERKEYWKTRAEQEGAGQ